MPLAPRHYYVRNQITSLSPTHVPLRSSASYLVLTTRQWFPYDGPISSEYGILLNSCERAHWLVKAMKALGFSYSRLPRYGRFFYPPADLPVRILKVNKVSARADTHSVASFTQIQVNERWLSIAEMQEYVVELRLILFTHSSTGSPTLFGRCTGSAPVGSGVGPRESLPEYERGISHYGLKCSLPSCFLAIVVAIVLAFLFVVVL